MRNVNKLILALALALAPLSAVGCATSDSDDISEADGEAAAPGQFDVYQSTDGQFRFRLLAGNKNVLLASEAYSTRTNAINGVLAVMENGVDPAAYEVAKSTNGKYFLRLHAASNDQLLGFTQLYSTKSNATRAVGSCVRAVTSYLDRYYTNTSRARVELTEAQDGTFSFNVLDQTGAVVVSSHSYQSDASALNGAFAIQEGAAIATGYKVLEDSKGFYFTATALNGAVVATSPSFTTREEASAALGAARALMPTIDVL
jgi:uncharacterized protein